MSVQALLNDARLPSKGTRRPTHEFHDSDFHLFKRAPITDKEMIAGGQILADMHYFMHDDLRNFGEHLNPSLGDESFHTTRQHKKRKRCFILLFGYIFPSVIPAVFTKMLMSWPMGITEQDDGRIVASNFYVNCANEKVYMWTAKLKLQTFLANPGRVFLLSPIVLAFILAIGVGQPLMKLFGQRGRELRHTFDFTCKTFLMKKLKRTRLISNQFFECIVWAYYGIVLSICAVSLYQKSLAGFVIAYAAGEVYLIVSENAVGLTGGSGGQAAIMIEAFTKTFALAHRGLWQRLDDCQSSVFAATSRDLLDVCRHDVLSAWSEWKIKDKMTKPEFQGIVTGTTEEQRRKQAKEYTYGHARVIKTVVAMDLNKIVHLAEETVNEYTGEPEEM
jgi:hypothetical protein